MDGLEKTPEKESLTPPSWERPSRRRRVFSALIDLVVWWTVLWLTWWVTVKLAHAVSGRPIWIGLEPGEITLYSFGFAALCANLYLAISNGAGRSVGKALTGLRLVVFPGPWPSRPGFGRGLVRSALQAGPWMGALMVATDAHDAFAGTTIARVADNTAWEGWRRVRSAPSSKWDAAYPSLRSPSRMAAWKIAVAVLLHLFFAMFYTVCAAL